MKWYAVSGGEALQEQRVEQAQGLTSTEIAKRQEEYGKNAFAEQKKESIGAMILRQLRDVSTIILLIAAALSFALAIRNGEGFVEPIVIAAIVVMNLILGITQERSAEKALDALMNLNTPHCMVLRDGKQQQIDTEELVPGDVVLLKTGDLIPADLRLLESVDFTVDESSLTGESEPSEKDATAVLEGKVALGDQRNMAFSGCLVTAGRATGLVIATGMKTEMGKIAGYLNNEQKLKTPLQTRLDKIGKIISFVAIISAVFLFAVGTLQGEDFWSMVLLAVSLAVAAVPETLSLIVTLSLSQGVKNMVQKHALIRKLPAVETLGSTSVICSDKTGTLTQNRMTIKRLWMGDEEPFADTDTFTDTQLQFLEKLALASSATIEKGDDGKVQIVGDPTESAIMRLLMDKNLDKAALSKAYPQAGEIAFSSARKMMTTVHSLKDGGYLVLTKGAFDRIPFEAVDAREMKERQTMHNRFAKDALRVIALGSKRVNELPKDGNLDSLEADLHFEGIIGLIDPPRPEAAKAIATAKRAGIRTVMITGDHAVTAGAIAREIGILSEREQVITGHELSEMTDEELVDAVPNIPVYARVSPEDKIRIVEAWQENGEVVAMTGDGVNDAPALKAADVGVSMGIAGTEVAKSASDMVLTDDNFATIVEAVHEGRNVFSNIRKTIYFLLVCNLSEIIIMLGAQLIGWGVPVTPVMLLLINVIGDGVPGLQLAREKSDPRIMDRKPIGRNESFFGDGMLPVIARQTAVFAFVTWIGYYLGTFVQLPGGVAPAHTTGQTISFLILGWTSILHIFTVRSRVSIFKRRLWDNPPLVISAVAMLVLFALLVAIPPLGAIFGLSPIGPIDWLVSILLSLIPTVVAEIGKFLDARNHVVTHRHRMLRHRPAED